MTKNSPSFTKVLFEKLILKHANGSKSEFARIIDRDYRWVLDKSAGKEGIPFEKLIPILKTLDYKSFREIDLSFDIFKERRIVDNAFKLLNKEKDAIVLAKKNLALLNEYEKQINKHEKQINKHEELIKKQEIALIKRDLVLKDVKKLLIAKNKKEAKLKIKKESIKKEVKRGRGRPKKENNIATEFINERKKHKSKNSWKRSAKRINPKL